jgi:hypothetical protein
MSSWYTSTWFEASDAQAWIPSGQNLTSQKYSTSIADNSSLKSLKTGKSDVGQSISKEVKLEAHTPIISPPQTEKFFQLPSNSVSDQNAWNAYVLSNSSNYWDSPNPTELQNSPLKPEKVVFSKFKRNVDIEEELTKQNLYKTELCQSWISTDTCRYGNKCQYAHGKDELRPVIRHPKYKTEICKTFSTTGQCSYGKRCRFVHTQDEEEINQLQLKLEEINLSLAPDPVFPATGHSIPTVPVQPPPVVKKGPRLPFLQKLRKL